MKNPHYRRTRRRNPRTDQSLARTPTSRRTVRGRRVAGRPAGARTRAVGGLFQAEGPNASRPNPKAHSYRTGRIAKPGSRVGSRGRTKHQWLILKKGPGAKNYTVAGKLTGATHKEATEALAKLQKKDARYRYAASQVDLSSNLLKGLRLK